MTTKFKFKVGGLDFTALMPPKSLIQRDLRKENARKKCRKYHDVITEVEVEVEEDKDI